ncbi:hypothetical protein PHYSODRAFT_562300 [Phytophthora sojae]|uniref:Uncharacterized protein n=1 Tax=Phytophthora sojae (strain P6497) TaxID=1094619 RepID=G4ZR87_PHYSP|nr:hypothetical protein PHYSODRAFT_562300 [Phytophthora sojae]EGZ13772.1 hypothetical protein PHYSODRAFT_562300 [Phytophthora sojae]|eukprot:XP_009531201.1 hypothetical protein PHYSODRAFT_562300 [Phytophthora sojae]
MRSDDDYEVHVLPAFVPVFWVFVAVGVVLFYYSLGYAKKYSTTAAFLLTPFICFSLVFDNAIMATTGIDRRRASTQAMLAFHACVTPMLLLVCYELAYMVHKHKSVNFCGISFESGHRERGSSCDNAGAASSLARRRWWLSTCLRFFVWLVGCALLVLNLLVTYRWTSDLTPEIASMYELQGDSTAHAVCAILPALVLVALALYIGLRLWNYGTNYSYMVHATCFNPWIWMLVGAVALLVGYLMPSPIYALSSNAGELIMMATIVRMFREVHHDMQQGLQFDEFIDPEGAAARRQGPGSPNNLRSMSMSFTKSLSRSKMAAEQPSGYMAVTTPKESELPATFANRLRRGDEDGDAQPSASAAYLSVVVARERTNPLCQ